MNNSYIYPSYQDNNLKGIPQRETIAQPLYANSILALNQGKNATFYLSFNDSIEWRDTILKGTIQDAGKDYTLLREATTGKTTLIWNIYIDYIIFDDNINQ